MKVAPRVAIAVVSLGAVLWIGLSDVGRTSPGPLTAVHAQHEDLVGWGSCSTCHGGWTSSMTDSCLACHEPIAHQLDTGAGLHGSVGIERAQLCALCHSEHHGNEFAIVNRQSFALAGVPDPAAFDHGIVGYEMAGKHLEAGCADCHVNAELDVLPAGEPRYLGLERRCDSCHEDSHEGAYGRLSCTSCHGQQAFDQLESSNHEQHLWLDGGHAGLSCRECHAENTPHALERHGVGSAPRARECADCHESPHGFSFLAGIAKLEESSANASCSVCHTREHESFTDERASEITDAQHAASGFALVAPHDRARCSDCHDGDVVDGATAFAERFPGRTADSCSKCHDDPHAGQFDDVLAGDGPYEAADCLACHARGHFEPHAFSLDHHALTKLALTGSHVDTECNACHVEPAGGGARTFSGTPDHCEHCHGDAHAGFFDEQHGVELAQIEHGQCAACHGTETFAKLLVGEFEHERWTGFALAGAHAQADCESCHPRSIEPDAFGRTFGRVVEHFGAYVGCISCHDDPHGGVFDAADLPASIEGRTDCARCHVPTSFRVLDGFDHGTWTGFPLDGAHAKASCSTCHPPLARPDEHGRTLGAARGNTCADCHDDPHERQFQRAGRTDCSRCHASATSFADLVFNHELHSRFRLGTSHRDLACSACHVPEPIEGTTRMVVRYRPMETACSSCHGQQRDPLRRRRKR